MIYQHLEPVWQARADYIVRASIEGDEGDFEQLWTHQLSQTEHLLCCIPFFLYNVCLGDVVEVRNDQMVRVRRPGGRWTFRAFCLTHGSAEALFDRIGSDEFLHERHGERLVSIDAANTEDARRLAGILVQLESEGLIEYETGKQ